jgi:protein O-mannosyl-transferase
MRFFSSLREGAAASEETLELKLFSRPAVQIVCLFILGLLIYSNTFHSPFVFDDPDYILNNPVIKDFSYFSDPSKIDELPNRMGTIKAQFRNRIVGHLSFWVNYSIHGLDVTCYHLVNLAIHLLNALLVYLLIILTFRTPFLSERTSIDPGFNADTGRLIAFLCALLFVAHPLQTQAVTYISQRFTVLATLFCLLSLILYIKARFSDKSPHRYAYYFISLVSVILAMKTKEISFTFPLIITLYEFMFLEGNLKKRIACLLPFILTMSIIPLTLLYAGSSDSLLKNISEVSRETASISRMDYLFTQFSVINTYISLLFLPLFQNLDYDYPVYKSFFMPQVWLPFLFLVAILIFALYLYYRSRSETKFSWRSRLISFGILFFFITLSVESSVIPIRDVIFEHRVYLPSFGFFLCVVTGIIFIRERISEPLKRTIIPSMLLIALIFAGAAYARNLVWSSALSLYADVVEKSPVKARPYYNLGNYYHSAGDIRAAGREYMAAIKLDPKHPGAHNNLGVCYGILGRLDEAVREFKREIKLRPDFVDTHTNLGVTLCMQGKFDEAISEYLIALKLDPNNAGTHLGLGRCYFSGKEFSKAVAEFGTVLSLDPQNSEARKYIEYIDAIPH